MNKCHGFGSKEISMISFNLTILLASRNPIDRNFRGMPLSSYTSQLPGVNRFDFSSLSILCAKFKVGSNCNFNFPDSTNSPHANLPPVILVIDFHQ